MKKTARLLSFILAVCMALSVPFTANASTTTSTIFISTTKYVHQTKYDGLDITEGIDVSYHNSNIDFNKVKAAGVKFVIIRAGGRYQKSGELFEDTKFKTYITDAHNAGLDIGVYFYSQAITEAEAKAEAEFTLKTIQNYKNMITLPVVMDYEFADNSSLRLDKAWNNGTVNKTIMTNNAIAFCDAVEAAGYEAMVYANKSFLNDQLDHKVLEEKYDIWLAHYIKNTNYEGDYRIWQFSEKGKVNGISGYVDCNFMYSSAFEVADISKQAHTGKAVTPAVKVTKDGKTLTKGKDYTVEYKNNVKLGQASAVVSGLGSLAKYPKVTKYFDIVPNVVTNLKATDVDTDTISVSWSKYSGATGYQVWINTPKGWVNLGLTDKTAYTFTGLTPDYQHEVSVRAYVQLEDRKLYGKYGDYLQVTTMALTPNVSASTNGWYKYNNKWYYFTKGKAAKNCWKLVEEKWYHFDENGVMQTGWLEVKGKTYYLNGGGAMVIGLRKIDGSYYYFSEDGDMRTGFVTVNNKKYYFDAEGKMQKGFVDVNTQRYYFAENGVMQTGWIEAEGKRYFAAADGPLVKEMQLIGGERYYFTDSYEMKIGWQKLNEKWYYFLEDGKMAKGWVEVTAKQYYLDDNGVMLTGWFEQQDGKRCYLKASGAMAIGWQKIDGKWYYFDTAGAIQTGFITVNGKTYYLKTDGEMVTGWQKLNNKWYYFTASGAMKKGWLKLNEKWYYLKNDGTMATGWLTVSGKKYYLKASGVMVTGKQKIDGKTYTFSSNGALQS